MLSSSAWHRSAATPPRSPPCRPSASSPLHRPPRFLNSPPTSAKARRSSSSAAGIAGLISAYELRKAGFDCTILEARNRPGGRSWSVRNGTKVEFTDGTTQTCTWQTAATSTPVPPASPPSTPISSTTARSSASPSRSRSTPPAPPSCSLPTLNDGKPVQQRQVVHDTRGYLAELLTKAINKHTLDDELSKEDLARLLDFLENFGDLDDKGKYTGTMRAGFITPRGAGPAQHVLHKPLNFSELLAADFSYGEFYEEQIDWQATMFQPIGGMDRIPYGFAKSLGDLIHYNCPVTEITTSDTSVTVAYTKAAQPQDHHRRLLHLHHAHLRPRHHQKQLLPRNPDRPSPACP